MSGDEDWRKTRAFASVTNSTGKIESDSKDWVSRLELVQKMGETGADKMIAHMEATNPEKCRYHPDAPGVEDGCMLGCFDNFLHITSNLLAM